MAIVGLGELVEFYRELRANPWGILTWPRVTPFLGGCQGRKGVGRRALTQATRRRCIEYVEVFSGTVRSDGFHHGGWAFDKPARRMAITNNNPYQALLRSRIKSTIAEAKAASVMTHAGVKGSVLEILVRKLFRPLLPADMGVGSGQIIDAYGSPMSGQVDIVLYDRSILPPILVDETTGIFPIESVLYTIEVKTTLNSTELRSAHVAAGKIAKFGYLPGLIDESGKSRHHPIERVRSVIFALGSDLAGTQLNEAQRYKNMYGESDAPLRAICVAGSGYWYDDGEHWIGADHPEEHDEVLAFIGGVTNTYKSVSESRHNPSLGNYVVPDIKGFRSVEARKVAKIPVTCSQCGRKFQLKPNLGKIDVVVIGTISAITPCSKCGGTLISAFGTYRFVKGKFSPEVRSANQQ